MSAPGTLVRLLAVLGAVAALAASASSRANQPPPSSGPPGPYASPPPSGQTMDEERALGLWKSSFGAVKIERDGQAGPGQLIGIWVYDRAGQEVIGSFGGPLQGNVLRFRWQEPARPRELVGEGYLVFDPSGRSFTGRWWTAMRDRGGDWTGWRAERAGAAPPGPEAESPPEGQSPPDEQGSPEQRPPEQGPAEQAPGPPPVDI